MATARPFAYNPGSLIPGTEQLGSLSVGFPTSGITNNPQYWNGPDEDLGYIIAQPVSANTQPTPLIGVNSSVGFFRTNGKNDTNFTNLTNSVYSQNFTTPLQSKNYLHANGLWTSWPQDLPEGVVLLLDAANTNSYPTTGTSWFDLSGDQNNGTLVNGPTFDSQYGGGLVFDGVDDYVSVPLTNLNYTPSDSFTMNVWAKGNSITGDLLAYRSASVFARGSFVNAVGIYLSRSTSNVYYWWVGSRAVSQIATEIPYTLGNIDNITYVYTPSFQYIYFNGNLFATQNVSSGVSGFFENSTYAFGINRTLGGGSAWLNGSVYYATMYNRALSSSEILETYNTMTGRFNL